MEWTRGPIIGHGASATVSLATAIPSGELFAVKSTDLAHSTFLQKEQSFLAQLSSPHIVKYMGFDISSENNMLTYNLCMEYVPGGTLSDAIKKHGDRLDESMIRSYTRQIVQGLEYLHGKRLVHCDIKGSNILVGKHGLKIADLGCAKLVIETILTQFSEFSNGPFESTFSSVFSGTPVFMAPEVARGEEQSFPADVWALGCTVIEMATGCHPWPEVDDPVSALYRIGFSGELPEFPLWFSEKAKDFLSKCLMKDPRERWTAKQLLQHPFLDELDLELHLTEAEEFTMNSPTTVLDQGLWDSSEMSETPQNPANSPAERIQRLSAGTSSSLSNLPNWTWDENWVTVRSNNTEESEKFTHHLPARESPAITGQEDSVGTTSVMASIIHRQEIESSIIDGDFLLESHSYKIAHISSFSVNRGVAMACEFVEENFFVLIISILRDLIRICVLFPFQFVSLNIFPIFLTLINIVLLLYIFLSRSIPLTCIFDLFLTVLVLK